MSAFQQQQQARRRLALKAAGFDVYAPRPSQYETYDPEIAARSMGVQNYDPMPLRAGHHVHKAEVMPLRRRPEPANVVMVDTGLERVITKAEALPVLPSGMIDTGRGVVRKDATGFPADRVDIDPTGAATAPAPKPPQGEHVAYTSLQQIHLNRLRQANVSADIIASVEAAYREVNAATVQKLERTTVFKSEKGNTIEGTTAKVEGRELHDADVQFISLVKRPANRTPFRIMKSASSEQRGTFDMRNVGALFGQA